MNQETKNSGIVESVVSHDYFRFTGENIHDLLVFLRKKCRRDCYTVTVDGGVEAFTDDSLSESNKEFFSVEITNGTEQKIYLKKGEYLLIPHDVCTDFKFIKIKHEIEFKRYYYKEGYYNVKQGQRISNC